MRDEELIVYLRRSAVSYSHQFWKAADLIDALGGEVDLLTKERRFILDERDRTFALMLARAEAAEAKVAKLVEALQAICATAHADDYVGWHTALEEATAALAEIEGGSND